MITRLLLNHFATPTMPPKTRLFLALLAFVALPRPAAPQVPEPPSQQITLPAQPPNVPVLLMPLKVMSFNIHNYQSGFWYSELFFGVPVLTVGNPPPWRQRDYETIPGSGGFRHRAMGSRMERVVQVIKDQNPAIVGLQEAYMNQVDALRRVLPKYMHVGRGRNSSSQSGESVSILYDTTRISRPTISTPLGDLPEGGTFWFSDNPSNPGSTWSGGDRRIATWARFRQRVSAKYFYVFNVHLQPDKDEDHSHRREKSVRLLLDRIADRRVKDPVIATGDFNAHPDETAMRQMSASRMLFHLPFGATWEWANPQRMFDSYRMVHATGNPGTKCRMETHFPPTIDLYNGRIDYIFVTPGMTVNSANRVDVTPYVFCPSDHVPIVATMQLP